MRTTETFETLARLLEYPRGLDRTTITAAVERVRPASPKAGNALAAFAEGVAGLSLEELEELFTRTFDLDPACCLEVGWQLYGDHYDRGTFLVHMRECLRDLKLPETSELPDHLTQVLRVLARLEEAPAIEFIEHKALPAVDKMLASFKDEANPYRQVLLAVRAVLVGCMHLEEAHHA